MVQKLPDRSRPGGENLQKEKIRPPRRSHWNRKCPKGPYLALFCLPSTLTTCHKYQDIFLAFQPCEILKAIQLLNLDLVERARWCCFQFPVSQPWLNKAPFYGRPQLLRRLPPLSVTFLGKEISPVPVAKDLGVFIDKTLSYNEHIYLRQFLRGLLR